MNAFIITAVSGSIMILTAVIFRALFAKRLHRKAFPILWAVIMLRLLIPVPLEIQILPDLFKADPMFKGDNITESAANIPAASLPVPSAPNIPDISTSHAPVVSETVSSIASTVPNDPELPNIPSDPVSPPAVLTVIWIIGMILLALYFVITYVRCMRVFSESLPISGHDYIDKWLGEHKLHTRKITVRSLEGIISPLTYGIFKPVILLPGNYGQLTDEELNIILTHEFIHIKRFDTAFKLMLTAVLCAYWFDPLVWLMYVLANRDVEFACDEAVLCKLGSSERQLYARTLLRMEELKSGSAPTAPN